MSGAYDTTTEDYSDLFNLTLKNFVDLVFGTPDNMLDKHFCSQSSFLPSRMVDSTLLIPLEKLSAFSEYIGHKYNIDINVNDSPHKTAYSATDCETLQITESTTLNAIKTHYEKHRNLPKSKELPPELINSLIIRFKQDVKVFRSSIIQSRILPVTG